MTVPNSSSSARSALDSAGWVMWHASAARPKWRCSLSAARYRIEVSRFMPAAPEGSGSLADGDRRELAREIACLERHLHGQVARHLLVDLRGFAIGLGHHGGLAAVGLQADLQRKGQCAQVVDAVLGRHLLAALGAEDVLHMAAVGADRKSTRLNSSHLVISYA